MLKTLRSILVREETEESISLRACSEKGTVLSAVGLWWTLERHRLFPYRWYAYGDGSEFPDKPSERGWRWCRRDFLVRSQAASDEEERNA